MRATCPIDTRCPAGRGLGRRSPHSTCLPFPSLDDQGCGVPIWPNNRTEGKRRGQLCFHGSWKAQSGLGRPGGEVPGAKPLGPHTHPWMLALLAESSQSHVLEGHVGTECLCPSGPGRVSPPLPPRRKESLRVPSRLGTGAGGSAWGHTRVWVCWGSRKPLRERMEGG